MEMDENVFGVCACLWGGGMVGGGGMEAGLGGAKPH